VGPVPFLERNVKSARKWTLLFRVKMDPVRSVVGGWAARRLEGSVAIAVERGRPRLGVDGVMASQIHYACLL
jgi:hypothetical protein